MRSSADFLPRRAGARVEKGFGQLGYLIFRSTFLPRGLGALMALSGLSWLTFLSPPFANGLLTPIEGVGILAEGALMLWLLVMGVNGQRWEEQAGAAGITRTNPIEALSAQ
jgi:Domain of unknown function (DUF4386)